MDNQIWFWLKTSMKSDNPLGVKSRITTFHACPRLVSILERGANGCRAGCGGSMVLVVYCTFLLTVAPDQGGGAASTLSMTDGNKQERNKQTRQKKTDQEDVLGCLHISEFTQSVNADTEMV